MTEDQFYIYLENALAELKTKQAQLQSQYGMGSHARWWFDHAQGRLQFYNDPKEHIHLDCQVVVLGTFNPIDHTWKWGWANETLNAAQRNACAPLKDLATFTAVDIFAEEHEIPLQDGMEWELTAMAVAALNLQGAYRAPSAIGKHHTFLGIQQVTQN